MLVHHENNRGKEFGGGYEIFVQKIFKIYKEKKIKRSNYTEM